MKKAFLFDMDGVLADTETLWDKLGYDDLLIEHFGQELFNKVKVMSGTSYKGIFDEFVKVGWTGDYDSFHDRNIAMGKLIYPKVDISHGTEDLIDYLTDHHYAIGVVSSSPLVWVEQLTNRLKNHSKISLLISVNNHKTLRAKPAPDPYLYAMKQLKVDAKNTIILEDSQTGVTAAKASGATTICFTAYHHGLDWQVMPENADYYVPTMASVKDIVAKIDQE